MLKNKLLAAMGGEATDPNFENVTLLLHGDGTNGGQNNTFVDGSTNNFTITRNGNTTQGSFSPYGDLWSNYFDGTGDWLETANNSAFNFSSSNFTVEAWIYTATSGVTRIICAKNQGTYPGGYEWSLFINTSNKLGFGGYGSSYFAATSTASINANTWTHVAAVRNGSVVTLYINGVADGTVTAQTYQTTTSAVTVGRDLETGGGFLFTGYISNLRIVKGTAVYTANFTPPTAPLTAITNTSLLTCQSNRFIDNSSNNFTITRNGDVSVQRFSSFAPSAAYSTATIGGSGYFDNSGDYLSAPASANLALGTGNFTLEAWVYATGAFATDPIFESRSGSGSAAGYAFLVNSSGKLDIFNNGGFVGQSSIALNINCWNHVAVVRSGTGTNQTAYYVNGAAAGTVTFAANLTDGSSNETKIGGSTTAGENWGGYVCDGRITKSAVYTGAFTPNTSPLTTSSSPVLLLNFTNGSIFDNAMMNDLETVGNAQISTSVKKYGTGSLAFDGSGDYLLSRTSPNLNCGTGDFTIECWVYINSYPGSYPLIIGNNNGSFSAGALALTAQNSTSGGSNKISLSVYDINSGAVTLAASSTNSFSTWYHVALVRNGTTLTLYRDGTSVASTTISSGIVFDWGKNGNLIGGGNWDGANSYFNGYVDDLRITKGVARYTANFTAPTAPFPNK